MQISQASVVYGSPPTSFSHILIIHLQVINFTTRRPDEKNAGRGYVWSQYDNVRVIHVWHDLNWTEAKIEKLGRTDTYNTTHINLLRRKSAGHV
jgi:hypothetical protein